jgi:hypothetical protein
MDIQDYINNNVIGVNNIEVDCTKWELMQTESDSSFASYLQTYSEAISSNSQLLDYNNTTEINGLNLFLGRFNNAVMNYDIARKIFYNSLICTPLDVMGSTTIPYFASQLREDTDFPNVKNIEVLKTFVTVDVDYIGKTSFVEQYYTDFQEAITELNEAFKDFLKLFYEATEENLTTPAVPFNGTC